MICPISYLQAHFVRLFMERHKMSVNDFLRLNKERDILGFLRTGYEPFHLTGDEGVLEEMDAYAFAVTETR